MSFRVILVLISLILISCSKQEINYEPSKKADPYKIYAEAHKAFEKGDLFYAHKKFSEAELNFTKIELAAKSSIMSSYSLYGINFYSEALENLDSYLKKYPVDKNIAYAHYLIAIIYYEQISDEKKI